MHITSPLKSRTTNAITAYGIRDLISLYCTRGKNIFCYCISDEFIFSVGKDFGIDYSVHELELVYLLLLWYADLREHHSNVLLLGYVDLQGHLLDEKDKKYSFRLQSSIWRIAYVTYSLRDEAFPNAVSVDLSSTGDEDEVSDQSFLDVDEDEVREDEDIETVMTPVSC